MYIVYDRNLKEVGSTTGWTEPPGINIRIEESEVSDFKPTWLVRVSDMQPVKGSSVKEHYWALSYSWNQSGEIFKKSEEEYGRIDEGQHQVITYGAPPDVHIETNNMRGYKKVVEQFDPKTKVTRFVKFEGFIQQLCKDFGIQYIWYDQMCINQNDHDAKIQEIRQMHLIYHHARCTLALIPELSTKKDQDNADIANVDVIPESEWSKRIWTLEEAYMSKNILFVGSNAYFWLKQISYGLFEPARTNSFLRNIKNSKGEWRACTALWYGRTRTSSKAHDRIFALANIFPELKDSITISYHQPLFDLMVRFYGLLAQKDVTALYFGVPIDPTVDNEIATVRQKEAGWLPSWTGVNGAHITQDSIVQSYITTKSVDYVVDGMFINMFCTCVPICIKAVDFVEPVEHMDNPYHYTKDGMPTHIESWYDDHLDGFRMKCSYQAGYVFVTTSTESQEEYDKTTRGFKLKATHFLPIKKQDRAVVNTLSNPTDIGGLLSLTEEGSECFIISDMTLKFPNSSYIILPVVKKSKEHYRLIGVCVRQDRIEFDPSVEVKQNIVIE